MCSTPGLEFEKVEHILCFPEVQLMRFNREWYNQIECGSHHPAENGTNLPEKNTSCDFCDPLDPGVSDLAFLH